MMKSMLACPAGRLPGLFNVEELGRLMMLRPFALSLWLLAFVAALLVLAIERLLEFETCLEEVMEVLLSSGQENE